MLGWLNAARNRFLGIKLVANVALKAEDKDVEYYKEVLQGIADAVDEAVSIVDAIDEVFSDFSEIFKTIQTVLVDRKEIIALWQHEDEESKISTSIPPEVEEPSDSIQEDSSEVPPREIESNPAQQHEPSAPERPQDEGSGVSSSDETQSQKLDTSNLPNALTGAFTTRHSDRPLAIAMRQGKPWLFWQQPDGQWVAEAQLDWLSKFILANPNLRANTRKEDGAAVVARKLRDKFEQEYKEWRKQKP